MLCQGPGCAAGLVLSQDHACWGVSHNPELHGGICPPPVLRRGQVPRAGGPPDGGGSAGSGARHGGWGQSGDPRAVLAEGIPASVLWALCGCPGRGLRAGCLQPGRKSFPGFTISSSGASPSWCGRTCPFHPHHSPLQRSWAWGELPPNPSPPGGESQRCAFASRTGYFLPARIHLGWLTGSVFFFGQRVVPTKRSFFLIPPLSNCFRMDLISPCPGAGLGSLLTSS